jgi:hypothetical protein
VAAPFFTLFVASICVMSFFYYQAHKAVQTVTTALDTLRTGRTGKGNGNGNGNGTAGSHTAATGVAVTVVNGTAAKAAVKRTREISPLETAIYRRGR